MATSSEINQLVASLAVAQGQFQAIGKDKSAKIQSKSGNSFSYDYADLATILAAVRKPLSDNGLAVMQPVAIADGAVQITTILAHASGQWIDATLTMPINDRNDARSVASSITYGRRYSLIALIGVAPSDEDDDGEATVQRPNQMAKLGERPGVTPQVKADTKNEPPPPSDADAPPPLEPMGFNRGKKVDTRPLTTTLAGSDIPFSLLIALVIPALSFLA